MKKNTIGQKAVIVLLTASLISQHAVTVSASVLTEISVGGGAVLNHVPSYTKTVQASDGQATPKAAPTLIADATVSQNAQSAENTPALSITPNTDGMLASQEDTAVIDMGQTDAADGDVHEVSDEEALQIAVKAGAGELFGAIELDDENDEEELASGQSFGYTNLGVANVNDHLNIRTTIEDDSKLVGKMGPNSGCEVLGIEGNKAHIASGSVEGYVSLDYLLTGRSAIERATEICTKLASVNADGLKLRQEPSTDSGVAGMVAYGEELPVVDDTLDGWVAVSYDGETLYVSADYVTVDEKLKTALNMTEILYGEGVSDVRVSLCEYAKQFLGNPYVWGGTSLTKGADCSGYVLSIFAKYGIYLPHSSRAQAQMGKKISLGEAKPGDLVFYAKGGRVNHVGIYIGGGQIINASSPKTGIRISNVYYRTPVAVRRILPD